MVETYLNKLSKNITGFATFVIILYFIIVCCKTFYSINYSYNYVFQNTTKNVCFYMGDGGIRWGGGQNCWQSPETHFCVFHLILNNLRFLTLPIIPMLKSKTYFWQKLKLLGVTSKHFVPKSSVFDNFFCLNLVVIDQKLRPKLGVAHTTKNIIKESGDNAGEHSWFRTVWCVVY